MASQLQQTVDDLAATAARLRNVAERVDRDPLSATVVAFVLTVCASSPTTLVCASRRDHAARGNLASDAPAIVR